ncbi:hypothetical protein DMN77_05395 [Paenibacillus sp. 79R4]|uniref:hypothetical protein n=1 Tax=Paenibacillus sp. 79R4 TaxID=2212847 RepID=UPI0015B7B427|nr:hypothetical protein [Paenibacillus sp. 79R4]NWL87032.1 hypothetical protein [Paenibacillus sp. 79R4]
MKYITFSNIENGVGRVKAIIINPYEEQMEDTGIFVDDIPVAESIEGFYPVLMARIETREPFYNYEVLSDPPIQEITLAEKVEVLEQAIAELTLMIATP